MINSHPKFIFKFCPKCGCHKFITTDNGRSFRCEECHFDYYINSSAAVACLIFNAKGEILLARRAIQPNIGMLDLPGGFIEPNETAEQAVIREIEEELHVTVTKMEYLVSFPNEYPFSGLTIFTLDMAFICQIDNIEIIKPDDDISSIEFYKISEINMSELCSDSMRNIIKYYITNNL